MYQSPYVRVNGMENFFKKNCIGFSHKTHRLFQEPRLGLYSFWWACSVYFCSLFLWYPVYCKGGEEGRRVFRRCLRKGQMDSGFDFSFSLLGYCGIQIFLTCPLGLIHLIPYSQLTAVATDAGPHSFLLYTSTLFLFLGWIRRPSGSSFPSFPPCFRSLCTTSLLLYSGGIDIIKVRQVSSSFTFFIPYLLLPFTFYLPSPTFFPSPRRSG